MKLNCSFDRGTGHWSLYVMWSIVIDWSSNFDSEVKCINDAQWISLFFLSGPKWRKYLRNFNGKWIFWVNTDSALLNANKTLWNSLKKGKKMHQKKWLRNAYILNSWTSIDRLFRSVYFQFELSSCQSIIRKKQFENKMSLGMSCSCTVKTPH